MLTGLTDLTGYEPKVALTIAVVRSPISIRAHSSFGVRLLPVYVLLPLPLTVLQLIRLIHFDSLIPY